MRQITACLAFGAIAFGASTIVQPAFAADDIGSNPITEFFDGLGLGEKEKPDLEYQERAPLVPPSGASLPAPQAKGSARAGAQWPNDPDVQARAERKARNNKVQTETYSYQMDRSPRVDPDELGARRTAGASVPRTATATAADNTVMRADPGDLTGRPITEVAAPGRSRLTDPPTGYMAGPSGAPAAPPPEQKPWYKKMFGG